MTEKKNIILIDGHALAFRQYYALERTAMRTSTGVPTWAVFGFFKAIFDLLKSSKIQVDALVVAFDVSHTTFRTKAFSEYKANREKMPDDMNVQMGLIYEGLEAFGIPIYKMEGYEADDVIGTISKQAVEMGHKVYILTGDKDSFQLVDKEGNVTVLIPQKGEMIEYDWDKIYEKMEVYPDQIVDFKALSGDQSDNIPGIKRIGRRTAIKWLTKYGSLEGIFSNIDDMNNDSFKMYLLLGRELAYQCQYLATIVRDLPINFDFDSACISLPDISKVTEFFTRMQFFSYLKNINKLLGLFSRSNETCLSKNIANGTEQLGLFGIDNPAVDDESGYPKNLIKAIEINTQADWEMLYKDVEEKRNMFFIAGVETQNIFVQQIKYFAIGVGNISEDDKTGRITMNLDESNCANVYYKQIGENELVEIPVKLKELLSDENIAKMVVDSKNEYNILRSNKIELNGVKFDAILASYLDKPSANHDIDVQALSYLNILPMKELNLRDATADKLGVGDDSSDFMKAMRKIWLLMELLKYRGETLSDANWNLLKIMELPLAKVLAEMEYAGVFVNVKALNELNEFFENNVESAKNKIFEIAGEEFNLNSPRQVGEMLFDKLNLPHKKRNRGGTNKYSTSAEILEDLAKDYEIASEILEYRKYSKLKTTYSNALVNLINPVDNRIHTTFNQTIAVTGRLSSTNPNLQNIPTRTEEGVKIRSAFIPQNSENLIVSADYSQIELRVLAHITKDSVLIDAYRRGIDVHTNTASTIYGVSPEEVTKDMRRHAKTVNFGIIYGQTRYGLAKEIGVSADEAGEFIERYFQTYCCVKEYMNEITEKVKRDGFVETIFGRVRDVSTEINSSNAMVREFAKRAAINFPMQGSAADMMKLAMIRFSKALKENKLKSKLIIQVHDEMVVETVKEELDIIKKLLKESMELDQFLSVPLVVNIKEGATWS